MRRKDTKQVKYMTDFVSKNNVDDYDTTINIIGGIQDIGIIYKSIASYFLENKSFDDFIIGRNEFSLRTERSRIRVKNAIKAAFLTFKNQDHEDFVQSFIIEDRLLPDRELFLFWQYALTNRLFREISSQVFIKTYMSGRTGLSKEDVVAYLKEFVNKNKHLEIIWSESTIHTLSTKYLNLMTKLNFLEGARKKVFRNTRPSGEALVLFLYFAKLYSPENRNILKNELLPLSFVSPEDLINRLKKLSIRGFLDMSYNGVDLYIELTKSYKGICDALYNRS
jgi:hypothetical protein